MHEGKPVVVERLFRTFKNKICQYMTSVPKTVYIEKLDDIVDKYNNTYHNTIKMKLADVKSSTHIALVRKLIIKILNLKLVILLEYQNLKIFCNRLCFVIKKSKKRCSGDTCY